MSLFNGYEKILQPILQSLSEGTFVPNQSLTDELVDSSVVIGGKKTLTGMNPIDWLFKALIRGGVIDGYVSETAPVSGLIGQVWLMPAQLGTVPVISREAQVKQWNGTEWVDPTPMLTAQASKRLHGDEEGLKGCFLRVMLPAIVDYSDEVDVYTKGQWVRDEKVKLIHRAKKDTSVDPVVINPVIFNENWEFSLTDEQLCQLVSDSMHSVIRSWLNLIGLDEVGLATPALITNAIINMVIKALAASDTEALAAEINNKFLTPKNLAFLKATDAQADDAANKSNLITPYNLHKVIRGYVGDGTNAAAGTQLVVIGGKTYIGTNLNHAAGSISSGDGTAANPLMVHYPPDATESTKGLTALNNLTAEADKTDCNKALTACALAHVVASPSQSASDTAIPPALPSPVVHIPNGFDFNADGTKYRFRKPDGTWTVWITILTSVGGGVGQVVQIPVAGAGECVPLTQLLDALELGQHAWVTAKAEMAEGFFEVMKMSDSSLGFIARLGGGGFIMEGSTYPTQVGDASQYDSVAFYGQTSNVVIVEDIGMGGPRAGLSFGANAVCQTFPRNWIEVSYVILH